MLDGEDVTELIRTPEISMAASDVGAFPEVRARLVELQQKIAEELIITVYDIFPYKIKGAFITF